MIDGMAVGARRVDGLGKLTGRTRYTQDLQPGPALFAKLVLSQVAAGRIASIDTAAALEVPGVVEVVTGADLPDVDAHGPDLPLARDRVYYAGQPVAAVLARSAEAAADAAQLVLVDYEVLPAVLDPLEATGPEAARVLPERAEGYDDASLHGGGGEEEEPEDLPPNVTSVARRRRGDVSQALDQAEVLVEGEWRMPGAHQGFLETHAVVAAPGPGGGVVISTPTQGLQWTRNDTAKMLRLPAAQVRVISMPVGGGFGGKFLLLEPLVALLALRRQSTVRLELTRNEEFLVGRAAPSVVMRLKLGAGRDGNVQGLDLQAWWDNGATAGWHGDISAMLAAAMYRWPAYAIAGYEVATNKKPADAYRAPGGTQVFFAIECAMDMLAEKLGMDPLELRLKNAVREGDLDHEGKPWDRIGFVEVLEEARRHPLYTASAGEGEAVGVAAGYWNGAHGAAVAGCRVEPDGTFTLQIGSVDISGSSTSLALVAAESLGVPLERISVELGDSATAPVAPGSGGSAITASVSPAVRLAALDARRQLLEAASEKLEAAPEDLELADGDVRVKGVPDRGVKLEEVIADARLPIHGFGRENAQQRSSGFTVHLARIKVDRETGDWRVSGYAAIQDVGRAVNPPEVEGQVQGGAAQGLGRALGEMLVHDAEGQPRVVSFLDYPIPSIDQTPDFQVRLVEVPSPNPLGVRGVGEPPNTPGPAVIANALARATGVRRFEVPILPEHLLR